VAIRDGDRNYLLTNYLFEKKPKELLYNDLHLTTKVDSHASKQTLNKKENTNNTLSNRTYLTGNKDLKQAISKSILLSKGYLLFFKVIHNEHYSNCLDEENKN